MPPSPELSNWKEIEDRLKGGSDSVQMAIGQATQNLTLGIVNLQHAIRGPLVQVWTQLERLNKNITEASTSSEKLSQAIKNATWTGAIIAGIGVFIAAAALIWDIYKTFKHLA
jgi:hypothetical protein